MKKAIKAAAIATAALAFGCAAVACSDGADPGKKNPTEPAKYTVTYDKGVGTGTAPTGGEYAAGEKFCLKAETGLSKAGHTFGGWLCSADNVTYDAGVEFEMPAYAVTFTAQWDEDSPTTAKYSVTVIKSHNDSLTSSVVGEIPTIANKAAGDKFTIPADTFSLAHYHQTKWRVQHYDSKDFYWATDANYNPDEEIVMPAHSVRITAVWEANTVTISFDANGGSGTMADNTSKQYNQTLSLPNCTFTAPAGKEFKGWATSPNGSPIDNGKKLDETIVKPNDTLMLYALWDVKTSTALEISEIAGHWTDATGARTLDISTETFGNNYMQGGGILDGKYAIHLALEEGSSKASDIGATDQVYYDISYDGSKLTLTPETGDAIVFTNKSALNATAASAFTGNWSKVSPSQPWVITADKAYYGAGLTEAKTAIVGSHITLSFKVGDSTYVYVLGKNGAKLTGWFIVPEKAPEAVEFNAGDFYTLTVNGTLNQIVNNGATVNTSLLPTSDDEGAITGWVVAGTSEAFDPATATITSNTSITAVHGESSEHILTGSVTLGAITVVKFTFDDDNNITAYDNAGNEYTVKLGDVKPSWAPTLTGYGADNATYYASCYIGTSVMNRQECGLYIKSDLSAIWVCDKNDNAISGAEFK